MVILWLIIAFLASYAGLWWLFFRNTDNEFANGVEISEDDLAGAVEGDLQSFISEQNGGRQ